MSTYAQASATENWLNRPLAIVGMDCRLPGADGLEAYWKLLQHGTYPIGSMPDSRIDRDLYFDAQKGVRGKTYADIGGFVAPRDLDWSLLNIDRAEASNWDECHLNFCEVAARACKHAGYDPRNLPNRNVGVFVGHSGGSTLGGEIAYRALAEDYVRLIDCIANGKDLGIADVKRVLLQELTDSRPRRSEGKPWVDAGFAAGIVSHCLGLTGPHLSIDAACASSLVALALGALSIHSGQTEMAIIGGASFNKTDSLILFSHAQSCSASISRPFDELADGLISSEGYVALVIKSLPQAEADGDRIHAIVRGIGISADGRGKSLWAPRKEGQTTAIERAYTSNIRPGSIQMIEAHATSTHLGDATEMEALAEFYSPHLAPGQRIPVGSVKSNIGHTLETAGLAGIVKSILAIENALIPPSINVNHPSDSIPWSKIPLYIARQAEPWPLLPFAQPRRAAVNAFGIGGLNVHVVVEQQPVLAQAESRQKKITTGRSHAIEPTKFEPIAVIGRGVVLPGALSVSAFQQQLQSARQARSNSTLAQTIPITDFHYDWRKHKVPPKQIAQANPLQFMLLDAAEQAFREAGLLDREFDRKHTAVVVGSAFGGDFGNALFAGLRLPEFRKRFVQLAKEHGIAPDKARRLAEDYETAFLQHYPALLDETGSFTSSTLASRLSKTFNLMGGALAVDCGDTSGLAALNSACHLLHSGTVKLVLCAAAQNALDRAAIENLVQCGRLRNPSLQQGYCVAEGVALVLLKPLRHALCDGDRVLGTIDDIGVGFDSQSLSASFAVAAKRLHKPIKPPAILVGGVGNEQLDRAVDEGLSNDTQQTLQMSKNIDFAGHFQAAQGLVDLISITLHAKLEPHWIANHTLSGQCFLVAASPAPIAKIEGRSASETSNETMPSAFTYRLAAASLSDLKHKLSELATNPARANALVVNQRQDLSCWQAAIICFAEELSAKAQKLLAVVGNPQAQLTAADQGLLWREPAAVETTPPAVAWIFPGQGSQYVGMLQELTLRDATAREALNEANRALADLDEPSFASLAWHPDSHLGENVWHTQAAMLIANHILSQTLRHRGLIPKLVSGHSFGEFAAMLAAECWDFRTALAATRARCRAIEAHVPAGYAMLSVQADADTVTQAIKNCRLQLTVSHRNAPNQTVAGGKQTQIAQLALRLEDDGIASRILPVPTAFHTSALEPAVEPFRRSLEQFEIHPPQTPLLSSISNCFIAEPKSIRDGLAQQLAQPLDFVGLVQRIVNEKVSFVFEVGPQQALTKLLRQTTDRIRAFPTDHPKLGAQFQLQIIDAIVEMYGLKRDNHSRRLAKTRTIPRPAVMEYDATQLRRTRMRTESHSIAALPRITSAENAALHFDATEQRRTSHRAAAATPVSNAVGPSVRLTPTLQSTTTPKTPTSIETFLIDFVVEQTGYPAEIIELDWDIEADLGIDSIKKAQLFGELREFFDLESLGSRRLNEFRTLRQIAAYLQTTPGKAEWLFANAEFPEAAVTVRNSPTAAAEPSEPGNHSRQPLAVAPSLQAANEDRTNQLTAFLIDFVVEQTGYPQEIIELDADLEADLGIDSIKKAQLFGELREVFAFDAAESTLKKSTVATESRAAMSELRTLRQILAILESDAPLETLTPGAEPNDSLRNPPSSHSSRFAADSAQQPTQLNVLPSYALGSTSIPFLDATQPEDSLVYLQAVSHNLRAMSGRIAEGKQGVLRTNGLVTSFDEATLQLAELCHALPQSILALNHALQEANAWQRAICTPLSRTEERSACFWFTSLLAPKWLIHSGTPIGIWKRSHSQVELSTPGCVMPMAFLRGNCLRVGGLLGEVIPEHAYDFSNALAKLRGDSLATLHTELEGSKFDFDWWAFLVDCELRTLIRFENRQGRRTVQSQNASFMTSTLMGDTISGAAVARLGIDLVRGVFVIQGQLQPSPYLPVTEELPKRIEKIDQFATSATETNAPTYPTDGAKHESATVAQRYVLRMIPAPQRDSIGRQPMWAGGAFIVGDNPIARQLEARLRSVGVAAFRHAGSEDPMALANRFTDLCSDHCMPHLFLLTPCDPTAEITLEPSAWKTRRSVGLLGNFWLCQKWFEHISKNNLASDASLIAVSSLGGDFGISGNIYSAEGGGVDGLLKSILIESWMQGFRSLLIKTIDTSRDQSPAEVVEAIWRELSVPSYDNEISYRDGNRHVVRAIPKPLHGHQDTSRPITEGSTWICTGGARGITAFVAEKLANLRGLKLHLLGTAPCPSLPEEFLELNEQGLRQLKLTVMTSARIQGKNPVQAWQDTEKAIEIDATLRRLHDQGIEAHYHSCNIADRNALLLALENVRKISGPIHGVLHGAGVGKDSRFDRKQPDKVEQCIAAKVDGALALMAATREDPLQYFIAFGSISGRFGANGHTDYSLANDMLCKTVGWLRTIRPEVRAIGFHWHAWGDVGMATKPETRLALEMIDMQFMPAAEGFEHLLAELEGPADESEVLITDDRYYRMFYPAETILANKDAGERSLQGPLVRPLPPFDSDSRTFVAAVNPIKDPFLIDHLLDHRPLLPFVVAAEMLIEAGQQQLGTRTAALRDIVAHSAVRFFSDDSQDLQLETRCSRKNAAECRLLSNFVARDGRVVERNRVNFVATAIAEVEPQGDDLTHLSLPVNSKPIPVVYPERGSKFYLGWSLQRLRKVTLLETGVVGQISAPALIELAGSGRDVRGWRIPSSALDACLYAVGVFAWKNIAPGSALPIRMGHLSLGRLPAPGEACEVHAKLLSAGEGRAAFNFTLYGIDGGLILNVLDYEIAWLVSDEVTETTRAHLRG